MREYEERGVQATLEMQQAARTVAIENSRLRMLLRRRGVADNEVDAFLSSFSEENPPKGVTRVKRAKRQPQPTSSGENHSQGTGPAPSQRISGMAPASPGIENRSPDRLAVLADASAQQDCCGGKTQCTMNPNGSGTENSAQVFTNPSMNTPGTSHGATPGDLTSPTTMSCTDAAEIVAEMQGHGDSDLAKAALGCGSQRECIVKNTALFQILEGSGGV